MGADLRDERHGNVNHSVVLPGMARDGVEDAVFCFVAKNRLATGNNITTTELLHGTPLQDDCIARPLLYEGGEGG